MSFYEVRCDKKSAVQSNDTELEEKKKTNLHERLAAMESALTELASELQFSQSTTLAVQGELKTFFVRADTIESDAKAESGSTRKQLLMHAENHQEHEKKHQEHEIILESQTETLQSQQETIQAQEEKIEAQQQEIQLLATRLVSLEETLYSATADGRKTNERLLLLEKRTEEGLKRASEHVEAGLEDLGEQLLHHVKAEVKKMNTASKMCRKKANENVTEMICQTEQRWKDIMRAERQRSDGIAERLSSFSVSGQRTLEQQIFETVETIGSLKSALEEQIRTMWEHMLRGDGERAHMSRQSTKLTQRVEDADRELNTVASQVNQAAKQAWEAARLANDGKDDVRAMERKLAKMTGTVAQSRESTLSALSHFCQKREIQLAPRGTASVIRSGIIQQQRVVEL